MSARCGVRCPHVIVADGVIESSTPQAFVDFLKSGAEDSKLKRIVFFNSRGGNVVASMTFGHILRELRIAGVVGRFHAEGDPGPYVGECLSACVYAMMGAVRRVAPPGSEVALHRMSIVETEGEGWFGQRTTRSFADAPMVAVLARYARRMGVNPALVRPPSRCRPTRCMCSAPKKCGAGRSQSANSDPCGARDAIRSGPRKIARAY